MYLNYTFTSATRFHRLVPVWGLVPRQPFESSTIIFFHYVCNREHNGNAFQTVADLTCSSLTRTQKRKSVVLQMTTDFIRAPFLQC